MIVLDASAVLELLMGSRMGARVSARIARPQESLHAPHVLDLEVAQVLRRYEAAGALTSTRAEEAFDDLADLGVVRYSHDELLPRIWQLRANLTAYDAAYVALAEVLRAPLLTCDAKLRAASGHRAVVEVLR